MRGSWRAIKLESLDVCDVGKLIIMNTQWNFN
jgi:hypothetical protein